MKLSVFLLIGASLHLASCAHAQDRGDIPERGFTPGDICNVDDLQNHVGTVVSGGIGQLILERSGARSLRWIPPNTAVTMDYSQSRLNISYDRKMVILKISCG